MKIRNFKLSIIFITFLIVGFSILPLFAFFIPKQEEVYINTKQIRSAQDPNAFISVWNTTKISRDSSSSNQVCLPLDSIGNYNFTADWGDGKNNTITIWNQAEVTHIYDLEGMYSITIIGIINGWRFNNGGDRLKILGIQQWGCLQLGNLGYYFSGCENLEITATDNLNLTGTTNLNYAFSCCVNLGSGGNINGWNVSNVTLMKGMFSSSSNWYESSFNQFIDDWDVSNVIDMSEMFSYAISFNQPLEDWDVSSVVDMSRMFFGASSFNQSLVSWDVSGVEDMSWMFFSADSFNQPLSAWNISHVKTIEGMFRGAKFNQPIGSWNVSNVKVMRNTFSGFFCPKIHLISLSVIGMYRML